MMAAPLRVLRVGGDFPEALAAELAAAGHAVVDASAAAVAAGLDITAPAQRFDLVLLGADLASHAVPALLDSMDAAVTSGGRVVLFAAGIGEPELARAGWRLLPEPLPLAGAGRVQASRRRSWGRRYRGSAPELHTQHGIKTTSTLRVCCEDPGYIFYGPYARLLPGRWVASVRMRGTRGPQPAGRCAFDICNAGQTLAAEQVELGSLAGGQLTVPFVLVAPADALELRLYSRQPVDVEVSLVEMRTAD